MKISIAGYSFHGLVADGMMDAFGYLETVKHRYRLSAADFWNGNIGATDAAYLKKVRQALDEREMVVANYHADGCHLWEEDPDARERNYRLALEHLQAAAIIGAKTVRIDTGGKLGPITEEQLGYLGKRYNEYCRFGADHGFTMGPETHWGLSLYLANMKKIAAAVDHPGYGILLHIGHWEDCDPAEGDAWAAAVAIHTHIDARITRDCLEPKIRLLLDAGYRGYWGVEHHSAKNEYAEVEYQLAEVRRALTRIASETSAASTDSTSNPIIPWA